MPRGRMLNKKISQDEKVAKLSIEATLLYTWCISHLDFRGRMYGDVWTLKAIVPHIKEITPEVIERCIKEWSEVGLVKHYGDLHKYLQFNGFSKNQTLREGREAESEIPTPSELQQNSSETPAKDKISKDKIIYNHQIASDDVSKFNTLWEAYPNKFGKKAAFRHYKHSIKSGVKYGNISKALNNYIKYISDNRIEKRYIKHGSTFFNNWEDYLNYEAKPKSRTDL